MKGGRLGPWWGEHAVDLLRTPPEEHDGAGVMVFELWEARDLILLPPPTSTVTSLEDVMLGRRLLFVFASSL